MNIIATATDCPNDWKQRFSRERYPEDYLRYQDGREIMNLLAHHHVVLITGEMGAGKSSALFVVRNASLRNGTAVSFFNGHFFANSKGVCDKFSCAINNPEVMESDNADREHLIIIDSCDYLYKTSRTARTGKSTHVERMKRLITWLAQYRLEHPKARFLLTRHDKNWEHALANKDLLKLFNESIAADAHDYYLCSRVEVNSLAQFISETAEMELGDVRYALKILDPENDLVISSLLGTPRPDYFFDYLQLLRNPRVMGHLFVKAPRLKEMLHGVQHQNLCERLFVQTALDYIIRIDLQSLFLPAMRLDAGRQSIKKKYGEHVHFA